MSTPHQPIRPSWTCHACGQPWPCPTRRQQLLEQYADAPAALALVLSSALVEACADLRQVPAGQLYDQFVGWLPSFGRPLDDGGRPLHGMEIPAPSPRSSHHDPTRPQRIERRTT